MHRASRLLALLVLPALVLACEAAPDTAEAPAAAERAVVDLAAEEQAIRARVDAWERAANESPEAFAAFYADDGVMMPANGPIRTGPAEIAGFMTEHFGAVENITFETTQVDVAESGDLAVERGRYTLRGTMPDGTAFDDEGKYLVAWEKQESQWVVVSDIFNSDRPMPGM
jgi:uncharacterized protein (TIGR02246 family)